jgi:hypothetical protein
LDFERLCFEGRTLDKKQASEQYEPWYATKDKTRYGWYKYLRRQHWVCLFQFKRISLIQISISRKLYKKMQLLKD